MLIEYCGVRSTKSAGVWPCSLGVNLLLRLPALSKIYKSLKQFPGVCTLPELPVILGFWYTQRQSSNLSFNCSFRPHHHAAIWLMRQHTSQRNDCWHLGGILSHNLKIRAHATRGFWSCQSVCRCIPLSRKHHVPECQVLPTKHNSSVALSGCHFTKPGRLGEITSICWKTNGR